MITWAYGITTVRSRINTTLPKTVDSLAKAGFDKPRLFVDGSDCGFHGYGLNLTYRDQQMGPFGNWILGLWELYLRNPLVGRYAMFQDDLITYSNLKGYLNSVKMPPKTYWNLYTFPHNQPEELSKRIDNGEKSHPNLDPFQKGFYPSCQHGKGAVALVFNQEAVQLILSAKLFAMKPQFPDQPGWRPTRNIDGDLAKVFKAEGWREEVHNPSLVQHTGTVSSAGSTGYDLNSKAVSFLGEEFDALDLIKC